MADRLKVIKVHLKVRKGMLSETPATGAVQTEATTRQLPGILSVDDCRDFGINETRVNGRKPIDAHGIAVLVDSGLRTRSKLHMPPGSDSKVEPTGKSIARLITATFLIVARITHALGQQARGHEIRASIE